MNTTATTHEKNIKLQLTRVFDAPREMVFRAWTDEKQFAQWFGGDHFYVVPCPLSVFNNCTLPNCSSTPHQPNPVFMRCQNVTKSS